MSWPGYVPWKEPKSSGTYTERYPTHFSFAPAVERVARDVVNRFDVSVNTYYLHPPPAPQYERVSLDVWARAGRGHRLDPTVGQKVFDYLFSLPGEPDIEWAIYRGSIWQRGKGWGPSPSGPADSDPRHDHHIHISYSLKHDVPKDDSPGVVWGVDLSSHQGNISHAQIRREGYSYAICKATEGTYFTDTYYAKNARDAQAAGLIPGAYHFLTNENVWQQIDRFLATVGRVEGKLIALDVEDPNWPAQYGNGSPSKTDIWNAVHYLHEKTNGHPILIYSGYWFWGDRLGNPDISSLVRDKNCRLWVSRYVSGQGYGSTLYQSVPAAWWEGRDRGGFGNHKPTILQFTESALVAGQYIDANAFRGTVAELRKLTVGQTPVIPPPAPEILGQTVIGDRAKPLRLKEGNAIALNQRKLGRAARFVPFAEAKEADVWETATKPGKGDDGMRKNPHLLSPDALELARELDERPDAQNGVQESDSPGPSNEATPINAKVPASVVGGGVGVALADVSIYVLERIPNIGDIPPHIEIATEIIVLAVLGGLAGYFTRSNL